MSPPTCELYSSIAGDCSATIRRRARPSAAVPLPVPVPNLTKKSRGRRVPTMEEFRAEAVTVIKSGNARKKGAPISSSKGTRTYTCDVDGCGKLFARGEHLKRHVRSIHTYEKRQSLIPTGHLFSFANASLCWLTAHRCPYPGCGKDFSRHDNLGQHMRVHKDYVRPRDAGTV
jgi:hypothetical protein